MIEVILDSSYVVAFIDAEDRWHQQASSVHDALKNRDALAIYFDCVLNETLSVIGKQLEQRGKSEGFGDVLTEVQQFLLLEHITWIYPEAKRWFPTVLALMQAHRGKLNFHDALIVLAAKEMGVRHIVSFDADFDEVEGIQSVRAASDLQGEDASRPNQS